jgi:hypothetical protein
MAAKRLLTLRLEPTVDGRAISGWIRDGRGDERYFTGWLELLTLLEPARALAGDATRPPTKEQES